MMSDHLQARIGDRVLDFDGRVVELFGFGDHDESLRFLGSRCPIEVSGPDKKGGAEVRLVGKGITLRAAPEELADVTRFAEAVASASAT
jgi:hypothetical protein